MFAVASETANIWTGNREHHVARMFAVLAPVFAAAVPIANDAVRFSYAVTWQFTPLFAVFAMFAVSSQWTGAGS